MTNKAGRKTKEAISQMQEKLYLYLLSIADPTTGRVAATGAMAGKHLGISANSARLYLMELCKEGKVVQISEARPGVATLYRIPSLCKGDTRTYFESMASEAALPTTPECKIHADIPECKIHADIPECKIHEISEAGRKAPGDDLKRAAAKELPQSTALKEAKAALLISDHIFSEILDALIDLRISTAKLIREVEDGNQTARD